MKKINLLFIVVFLAVTSVSFAADKKIVEYKNGSLTYADLQKKMNELWGLQDNEMAYEANFNKLSKEDKENLIKHVIISELLVKEAKKEHIQNLSSYTSQLKRIETDLLQQVFLQEMSKKEITEEKIKAKYQELLASKANEEEIKASHILVETEAEAKKLYELIKNNKGNFADLAKEKSKDPGSKELGGELGYFSRGQMVKPFEDTAFALEINQVSAPVKTNFGWHIIKLHDRRKLTLPDYQAMYDEIKTELESSLARIYIQEKIREANIKFNF